MPDAVQQATPAKPFVVDKILMGHSPRSYVRSLLTPFNVVAGLILAAGLPLMGYRFANGLASITNLSQESPWGLWIGLDVLSGVALAAGGYTIAASVYIFRL